MLNTYEPKYKSLRLTTSSCIRGPQLKNPRWCRDVRQSICSAPEKSLSRLKKGFHLNAKRFSDQDLKKPVFFEIEDENGDPPASYLDKYASIYEHLTELKQRALVAFAITCLSVSICLFFARELTLLLEHPVADYGVRFLQLSPGEYFFTTIKVSGYVGMLISAPAILYQIIAFVVPGLTDSERDFLAPIVLGSSVLFYAGVLFAFHVLAPAALEFFVSYANGAVESLWSIDQYFEFVLALMLGTGLAFQVPVVQVMLGRTGLVSSSKMLSAWKYVVVGATVAAAVLTPSTDPITQALLAVPMVTLYIGGALAVRFFEKRADPSSRPEDDGASPS